MSDSHRINKNCVPIMANRKYQTEFGLHMFASNPLVCQADDFERSWFREAAAQNPCHVYMICSRPRIIFDLESFTFNKGLMKGRLQIQRPGGVTDVWFETPTEHTDTSRLQSPYPHTQLHFLDENGAMKMGVKAQCFFQIMALERQLLNPKDATGLHLKVLYVGQAYGTDGSRQATDRLMHHETLQKVYAEIISREPHKEVWLALLSFQSPLLLMNIEGREGVTFEADANDDKTHVHDITHSELSWHQQINFAEASLIRYFQPKYNKEFKDTFPSPAHKTYAKCYDLDLNAVSIELQTGETLHHFYSDEVAPNWVHLKTYPLHSKDLRKSMFDDVFVD